MAGEPATNECPGRRELECCDAISTEERRAGALFSRDAVGWPRYQIASVESSMWSPSPDGNHWWGSAVSQGRPRVPDGHIIDRQRTDQFPCRRADLQGPGPDSRWNSPHWALKEGGLAHPSPRTPPTSSRLPLVPLDRDGANLVAIRGSVSIFRIFGPRLS